MQPYSLITAKNRMLSPSAQLLYAEIEAGIGGPGPIVVDRRVTCHFWHFAPEAAGLRLESRDSPGALSETGRFDSFAI